MVKMERKLVLPDLSQNVRLDVLAKWRSSWPLHALARFCLSGYYHTALPWAHFGLLLASHNHPQVKRTLHYRWSLQGNCPGCPFA